MNNEKKDPRQLLIELNNKINSLEVFSQEVSSVMEEIENNFSNVQLQLDELVSQYNSLAKVIHDQNKNKYTSINNLVEVDISFIPKELHKSSLEETLEYMEEKYFSKGYFPRIDNHSERYDNSLVKEDKNETIEDKDKEEEEVKQIETKPKKRK